MMENEEAVLQTESKMVLDLNLTLPLEFVKQWVRSKIKQTWTARINDCSASLNAEDGSEIQPPEQNITCSTASVTTNFMRQESQKAYVCVCFERVQLRSSGGKLELCVADIAADKTSKSTTKNDSLIGDNGAADVNVDTTSPLKSDIHKESVENNSTGAVKRKRGRPRKLLQNSTSTSSTTLATGVDTPAPPDILPATRGHYSLRGKKLPRSIFGDSGSESEFEGDNPGDDDEYRPKGLALQISQRGSEDISYQHSSSSVSHGVSSSVVQEDETEDGGCNRCPSASTAKHFSESNEQDEASEVSGDHKENPSNEHLSETNEHFSKSNEHFRKSDEHFSKSNEHFRKSDEHFSKSNEHFSKSNKQDEATKVSGDRKEILSKSLASNTGGNDTHSDLTAELVVTVDMKNTKDQMRGSHVGMDTNDSQEISAENPSKSLTSNIGDNHTHSDITTELVRTVDTKNAKEQTRESHTKMETNDLEEISTDNSRENDQAVTSRPVLPKKRGRPKKVLNEIRDHELDDRRDTEHVEHSSPSKKRMKVDMTGLPTYARRKRTNTKQVTCKYCKKKFCDHTGVLMHVRKFHSSATDCDSYAAELSRLSVVKCALCDKIFDNRIHLQRHEDKVHVKVGEIPCSRCGKVFANLSLVKQHVRYVHQVEGQEHACTMCPARFKAIGTLRDHVREVHNGEKRVSCSACGKQFYHISQLNRHARVHDPDDSKLSCDLCGRKFTFYNNLQRHKDVVHNPKTHETCHCAYCGKGFQRKESLQNHLEKLHFSIFPYNCLLCKAGFVRGPGLEKHMGVAHRVSEFRAPPARPERYKYNRGAQEGFFCDSCGGRFFFKSQLVEHIFTTHRDAFGFHCYECPQVFTEESFLVVHVRRAHGSHSDPDETKHSVCLEQSFLAVDGRGAHSLPPNPDPVDAKHNKGLAHFSDSISTNSVRTEGLTVRSKGKKPFSLLARKKEPAVTLALQSGSSAWGVKNKDPKIAGSVSNNSFVIRLESNAPKKEGAVTMLQTGASDTWGVENKDDETVCPVTNSSSFVIRVENGDTTKQYVIENPPGDTSIPSDAVVQNIAQFILSGEGATEDGVILQHAGDQVNSEQLNVDLVEGSVSDSYAFTHSLKFTHSTAEQSLESSEVVHHTCAPDDFDEKQVDPDQTHADLQNLENQNDLNAEHEEESKHYLTTESFVSSEMVNADSELPSQQIILHYSTNAEGEYVISNFHNVVQCLSEGDDNATGSEGVLDLHLLNSVLAGSVGVPQTIILTSDSIHELPSETEILDINVSKTSSDEAVFITSSSPTEIQKLPSVSLESEILDINVSKTSNDEAVFVMSSSPAEVEKLPSVSSESEILHSSEAEYHVSLENVAETGSVVLETGEVFSPSEISEGVVTSTNEHEEIV